MPTQVTPICAQFPAKSVEPERETFDMVGFVDKEDTATDMVLKGTRERRRTKQSKMGIVRCTNFRCLAVRGADGVWRDAHDQPLEVVEVITEF